MAEWTARFVPSLFGFTPDQGNRINDERIGRNLDMLYDSDRCFMLTDLAARIEKDFHINVGEIHNDAQLYHSLETIRKLMDRKRGK